MKRKYADIVKSKKDLEVVAEEVLKRISEIYHLDKQLKDLSSEERQKQRIIVVRPKVDDYFAWVKNTLPDVPSDSETAKALRLNIPVW